jgi:poly(3-hydroxybutyrate) depolymerase
VKSPPLLDQAPRGTTASLFHKGATMPFRTVARPLTSLAVCLLLLGGLAALAAAQQEKDKGKKTYGKIEKKTYEFEQARKTMEYALYVPSTYDKEKQTPLVVALHGLGGNPQQMIRSKGLTEQAEKRGYIVVAPMGYNSRGWYGALGKGKGFGGKGFGKDKGKGEDVPDNLGELSEKDVMNVLEIVRKEFNVDKKRIYLIGHSMGGAGAYHLGAKYSEVWAGLGPIAAATGAPKNVDKLKDVPVIVVHGDKDTAVKVASARRCVEKLKENKIVHEYLEIEGAGHGDVIGKGMPKIFEFFEKQYKEKQARKEDKKEEKKEEKKDAKKEDKKEDDKQDKDDKKDKKKDDKPVGQRVFYASHSLMWDMPPVLAQQVEAYGIKGHTIVGHQRIGVSRASQHWNRPDDKNEAKKALKAGKVDVFVMSPLVHPDEGITKFVKLGLEHNPKMKFLLQISWPGLGFTDNEQFNAKGKDGGFGKKGAMFGTKADNKPPEELVKINAIDVKNAEAQVKKLNEELGKGKTVVFLVPTAQAHNALRTLIYKKEMPGMKDQSEVFKDPIGHPSPPVVALNAYLHFAVLYGRSPVGLPMPSILKNAKKAEWDEKMNRKLQELAWDVVKKYPPCGVASSEKQPSKEDKGK